MTATTAPTGTYKAVVGEALAGKTAGRVFMDKLKATPRKARTMVASMFRALRLENIGKASKDGLSWLVTKMAPAFRLLSRLGLTNLVGLVFTTPLRAKAVKALGYAYKAITFPVRIIGRGIAWFLNKFKAGRKIVEVVTKAKAKAEAFVVGKVNKGLAWLETKDQSGGMRWLRWFFQANLIQRGLRILFPAIPAWSIFAASLFVPVFGDKSAVEEANITRAKEVLANVKTTPVAEQPKGQPTPKRSDSKNTEMVSIPLETAVLRDSTLAEGRQTFECSSFAGPDGVRRYFLGSQVLTAEDLPDNVTVVEGVFVEGEPTLVHPTTKVEETVRAAQANPSGRPPRLPRAAQRATRAKASSKK